MAKKSAEDLDAELAKLEAELASLSGKKAPPAEKKSRLPSFGRKKAEQAAAPAPTQAPAAKPPASAPPPAAPEPARAPAFPVTDASVWRQEGEAWVRTVPSQPRLVRRILDENGNTVREEAAKNDIIDAAPGAQAERGVGKLLGRFKR